MDLFRVSKELAGKEWSAPILIDMIEMGEREILRLGPRCGWGWIGEEVGLVDDVEGARVHRFMALGSEEWCSRFVLSVTS